MLILKIVALGPIHGYAISQRIQQISKDFFQVPQGSLYPALHRLEDRGLALRRTGANPKPAAKQNFTSSREKDAVSWRPSSFIGRVSPTPWP